MDPKPQPEAQPSRPSRPVRDGLGFFGNFLKNPTSVGAVLPSSRYLSRALVGDLSHLQEGDLVLEYGPGTGPMTSVIHDRLPRGARYLGVELQETFCDQLRARFPGMAFHCGSAGDVQQILKEHGLPRPARVVSGLPFASLPAAVQDAVVDGLVWALRDSDSDFRTFQYAHAYSMKAARRFRALMEERFVRCERIGPIVRNVPPAFVLRYQGVRS